MTDHDDTVEETVMLTRRRIRSQRTDAVEGAPAAESAQAEESPAGVDEHTVVIERRRDPVAAPEPAVIDDSVDDRTVAIGRRLAGEEPEPQTEVDLDESTVMLGRRRRSEPAADETPADDASSDDAVEDRTIAVDRRRQVDVDSGQDVVDDAVEDRTIAVDRRRDLGHPGAAGDPEEDHTVAVDRRLPAPSSQPRRTDVIVAPPEDLDVTVPAAPPRRVDAEPTPAIYKPRAAPRAPSRPPVVHGAIAPTRVLDEEVESVGRRARRISVLTLASVVGACAVSVGGLVALAFLVFS